jgi:hypothetical protein
MKYLLLFSIMLFGTTVSFAQCWQTINTQTTDWRNFAPNGNSQSTNSWNWTLAGAVHEWYGTNSQALPTYIELPYFCSNPAGSGSCGNLNTYCYEVLGNLPAEQDIWPEDGWELLIKSFGVLGKGNKQPYFVLYNKYTGKLKIYMGLTNYTPATSAAIEVGFDDNDGLKRALFNHVNFAANTLQEFKPANKFYVPNNISQEDIYWLVAEVQTSYDPCNCSKPASSSDNISNINVQAYNVTTTSIDATINGSIDQSLQSSSTGTTQTSEKFALDKGYESALKGYQSYSKFATQMNGYVDKLDKEKQIQLAESWLKEKQKKDVTFGSSLSCPDLVTCYLDDKDLNATNAVDNFFGLDKEAVEIFKKGASVIPYVGAAIGLLDYVSNLGNDKTKTSPKAAPISFQANLKLEGTLSTSSPLDQFSFFNPGSVTSSSSVQNIPFYNNTLGVFNMLHSPKFEYYDIQPKWHFYITKGADTFNIINKIDGQDDKNLCEWMKAWKIKAKTIQARQYQVKDLVKFVLNPASELDVENIEACIVFDYKKEDFGIKDPSNPSVISNALFIKDGEMLPQTPMLPYYKDITKQGLLLVDRIKSIEATGLEFETVNKEFPLGDKSFIRFRTKYLPLSCLGNLNFTLVGKKPPTVYIKMRVVYKPVKNKSINPVQIITYNVSDYFAAAEVNTEQTGLIHMGVQWNTKNNFWNGHYGDFTTSGEYIEFKNCWASISDMTSLDFNFIAGLKTAIPNPYNDYTLPLTYNPTISPSVAWLADIVIPANTVVPANSKISTTGKITIEPGVTISDGCSVQSEKIIDIVQPAITDNPTVISPTAILEINSMALIDVWGSCDPTIGVCRATNSEIDDVCKSKSYVTAVTSSRFQNSSVEADNNLPLIIYPNPTSNYFKLSLASKEEARFTSLRIFDITGKLVFETNELLQEYATTVLTNGTYFVEVKLDSNVRKIQKLVVSH